MNNESEFTDEYVLKLQEEIEEYKEIEKSLIKEIDKLTAESTEWEERTYCWQDRAENLQIVLDKIKEYCELNKEFTPRLEDILELLEEIE